MSTWFRKLGLVSLGWIALTCAAGAQSTPNGQDMSLGDVWISSAETGAHQRLAIDTAAAPESDVLPGDVWIAADDLLATAQLANHAQRRPKTP